jgi:hypothetical protein
MPTLYFYKRGVNAYDHSEELPDEDITPDLPPYSTLTPPLPALDPAIAILWNPTTQTWQYHEIPMPFGVPAGYMDELMTYVDIRIRHYPPKEDYLDALVKNDTVAMEAYVQACLDVKARWPKDMEKITRREYFVQVYGMVAWMSS